jgi:peptidoglycan/LPS O-acetylase OafA/YrhL
LWLGALSYCIYLTNEPVHKLLGLGLAAVTGGDGELFSAFWLPGAVGLPLLLSAGLHACVEVPALQWGRRYARRFAGADSDKALTAAPSRDHLRAWQTLPVSLARAKQEADKISRRR